jgi:NADH-quinone oxidoreductase subunit A
VRAYLPILLLLVAAVSAVSVLYALALVLAPSRTPLAGDPYLSGHPPAEHALGRFHARWYAVMLLFLAFDMEMVFMYPWAVVFADVGTAALVEMGIFLLILTLGILYAWREGALRWS